MHNALSLFIKAGLLVCAGLMWLAPVNSQSVKDSLLKEIGNTSDQNAQADLYFELGYQLRNKNIQEAESAFLKSLKLAEELEYIKGVANARFGYGIVLGRRNELDSALYYYRLAGETLGRLKLPDESGRVLNSIGLAEYRKGNLLEAQENLKQVLMDSSVITDSQLLIMVHNNLAMVLKKSGDLVGALQYYQAALHICETQNDWLGKSKVLNNVGLLYETLNQPELAIDYFNQVLEINRQQGWRKREAWPLHNIGLVYEGIHEYDKSLDYYNRSLKIKEELQDQRGISISLNNIGIIYKNQGKYDLAAHYFQKSLELKQKIGLKDGIAHTLTNMGSLHQVQKHYQAAIFAYKQAEIIAVSIQSVREQLRIYQGLYNCYKAQGEFQSAVTYLAQYSDMKEALFNEENSRQIANLEIKYQTEHKEKENNWLRQQNELNQSKIRYQLIIGFILCLAMLVLIYLLVVLQKRKRLIQQSNLLLAQKHQEVAQKARELETVNTELQRVSQFKTDLSGMIVHDLKNPLNAIINIVHLEDENKDQIIADSGRRMLNLVMNILDVNKYESTQLVLHRSRLCLKALIGESLKDFQFSARQQNITIDIQCAESICVEGDADLILRVLNNLISNAMKYSPLNGCIMIHVDDDRQKEIKVTVKDQGPGVPKGDEVAIFEPYTGSARNDTNYASTGLGLAFCKMAVQAHQGQIGVESDHNGGAVFWFTLPVVCGSADSTTDEVFTDEKDLYTHDEATLVKQTAEIIRDRRKSQVAFNALFQELEATDVYEVSRIGKMLQRVSNLDETAVEPWVEAMQSAVMGCDQKKFRKLMGLINLKN